MKRRTLFIVSLAVLFLISACTNKSEKTIDSFFEAYNSENYSDIENMSYKNYEELMVSLVKDAAGQLGKIEEYNKYSFNSSIEEGKKKIELYYECEAADIDKTVYFKFELIEDDDDPKILSIIYSSNQSFIDNYNDNRDAAVETVKDYYKYLQKDDSESIYNILDESITDSEEIVDMFYSFIDKRRSYYGRIENVEFSHSRSEFYDEKSHFHVYYKCTPEDGNPFYESISVVENGKDFKIFDYKYGETISEIENL